MNLFGVWYDHPTGPFYRGPIGSESLERLEKHEADNPFFIQVIPWQERPPFQLPTGSPSLHAYGKAIPTIVNTHRVQETRSWWWKHERIAVNGIELDGWLHTSYRNGRTTLSTCYGNGAVLGHDTLWLIRMNLQSGKLPWEKGK